MKQLTTEQLEMEVCLLCGGKQEPHDINGETVLLWNVPGVFMVEAEPPRYCWDISVAWPLIALVHTPDHADYKQRTHRWGTYWEWPSVPRLHAIVDEEEASTHIALAAYYALTGERVTITE